MSKPLQATKVYLSADALFDMRLGTLLTLSEDFALEVTTNPKYFIRTSDVFSSEKFGELSVEVYDKILEKYKHDIVKNSVVNRIFPFLANLILELRKQEDKLGIQNKLELDINLYPFSFSDEEAVELLNLILSKMGKIITINLVSLSPQEMTASYVASNYLAVIMYRYHEWFNMHNEEVKKRVLSKVAFYLPRVNFLAEFTKEQLNEFKSKSTEPFELFAKAMRYFAPVQFVPVSVFSADLPGNPE